MSGLEWMIIILIILVIIITIAVLIYLFKPSLFHVTTVIAPPTTPSAQTTSTTTATIRDIEDNERKDKTEDVIEDEDDKDKKYLELDTMLLNTNVSTDGRIGKKVNKILIEKVKTKSDYPDVNQSNIFKPSIDSLNRKEKKYIGKKVTSKDWYIAPVKRKDCRRGCKK